MTNKKYEPKWNWNLVAYGHARRELILAWLKEDENNYIGVNKRGCPLL